MAAIWHIEMKGAAPALAGAYSFQVTTFSMGFRKRAVAAPTSASNSFQRATLACLSAESFASADFTSDWIAMTSTSIIALASAVAALPFFSRLAVATQGRSHGAERHQRTH